MTSRRITMHNVTAKVDTFGPEARGWGVGGEDNGPKVAKSIAMKWRQAVPLGSFIEPAG